MSVSVSVSPYTNQKGRYIQTLCRNNYGLFMLLEMTTMMHACDICSSETYVSQNCSRVSILRRLNTVYADFAMASMLECFHVHLCKIPQYFNTAC